MSTTKDLWFKARINESIDDAITQLATELGVDRSEAGRELLRRGAGIQITPVTVRPQWSDDDLRAMHALREPAHRLNQAAKTLRSLVDEECGANMELRGQISTAAKEVYGQYIAMRDLRDALLELTAPDVEAMRGHLIQARASAAKGNPTAPVVVKLLEKLGF